MMYSPLSRQVDRHKALGHPARLRVLAMLRGGELCVCQITAVLQLAASTVSAHLAELKRAGLVEERKEGRWVHYRLADGTGAELAPLWPELDGDNLVVSDRRLLEALKQIAVELVCRPDFDLARLVGPGTEEECCS
jgi:DNA-binding transcriptional ArsR family regulator